MTGAAGRRMRLTGSNSPDRMLTDQFDSRSESTRTLHSLPSQVAVAMARVVPEARASMVETARRERARKREPERLLERNCPFTFRFTFKFTSVRYGADGTGGRRDLLGDARRVRLDPDHRDEPDDHHQKRDVEKPAIVLLTLFTHRADPGELPGRHPVGLALAADEIVGGDDAGSIELQELLLGADGQLSTGMAHVELHGPVRWRRSACSASKRDTLRCEICYAVFSPERAVMFALRRAAPCGRRRKGA